MAAEQEIEQLPDDESWVFESLVNFLHGPLWKLPVSGFMEEKSVVFDPESYNELTEEREIEYRKIHEEYKALVDFMLGSFMEDLEVTPEQVEDACRSRDNSQPKQDSLLTKTALQQLQAAEDFGTFRRLMTRKNIDLQLQSLELMVSKYGVLSPSLRNSNTNPIPEAAEEDFLQLVLRYTQEAANLDAEELLAHPPLHKIEPSIQEGTHRHPPKSSQLQEFHDFPIDETISGEAIVKATIEPKPEEISGDILKKTIEEIKQDAPEQREQLNFVRRAVGDNQKGDDEKVKMPKEKSNIVSDEDIQRRREYMRDQRDKLVALKKKERERIIIASSGGGGTSRPKSARAAQLALKTVPKSTANEKSLAARRALADRLKKELQPK